jgi:hypothetical protein
MQSLGATLAMNPPRPCSEFPNDNPALHDGVVWRCVATRGGPRAVVRLVRATLVQATPVEAPPAEPASSAGVVTHRDGSERENSAEASGFEELVAALAFVALERGATRAAAVAQGLLRGESIDVGRLVPEVVDGLVRGGFVVRREDRAAPSASLLAIRDAWRDLLDGHSTELPAGLETPLDEWAAALLGVLLLEDEQSDALRRELRRRGVAAFGLVDRRCATGS